MNITFAKDLLKGLSQKEKYVSSKYLYDDNGSRIFQEIMKMPEYYLTASEYEILSLQTKQIIDALKFKQTFNIVELGAGDGFKTFKLLEYLTNQSIVFNYIPIDISQEAVDSLTQNLKAKLPTLSILPKVGDYFEILKEDNLINQNPSLLLFLGSNIGNYTKDESVELLSIFNSAMNKGDKLLIGMDLKKNPITIYNAYNDSSGITKRFNLNLLLRINKEFEGDFRLDNFDFYSYYDPSTGEVKSYIVSLKKQTVYLKKLDQRFNFDYDELIWTELSKKYSLEDIDDLAKLSGFTIDHHFLDCKHYFTDSLWEK